MLRSLIFPLLMGLVGAAVLIALGVWQLQRLQVKEAELAKIEARIGEAAVPLPASFTADADKYLATAATGRLTGSEALVLTSLKEAGPGYRVIAAFEVAGDTRKVMVDLGFVTEANLKFERPTGQIAVVGNLHWPDETDSFTPEPDLQFGIWFARDVERMANILGTEQVLIVARSLDPAIAAITPLPVDTASIPNNHLNYAITWFSLTVVWLGMTALLVWRITRRTA